MCFLETLCKGDRNINFDIFLMGKQEADYWSLKWHINPLNTNHGILLLSSVILVTISLVLLGLSSLNLYMVLIDIAFIMKPCQYKPRNHRQYAYILINWCYFQIILIRPFPKNYFLSIFRHIIRNHIHTLCNWKIYS